MIKARNLLKQVGVALESHQEDESRQISVWRRWVSQTLEQSRAANSYAVIVDKVAHKTYLVKGGKLLHTYDSELGYNSARQKLFSGDAATPEGMYRVVKENNQSKFYRALLIDYPNGYGQAALRRKQAKRRYFQSRPHWWLDRNSRRRRQESRLDRRLRCLDQ